MAFRFAGEAGTDKKLIGKLENPETLPGLSTPDSDLMNLSVPTPTTQSRSPGQNIITKAAPGAGRPG